MNCFNDKKFVENDHISCIVFGHKKYLNNLNEWSRIFRKIYYRDLPFGGVQDIYKKANEAHTKIIIIIIVKEWLDKE